MQGAGRPFVRNAGCRCKELAKTAEITQRSVLELIKHPSDTRQVCVAPIGRGTSGDEMCSPGPGLIGQISAAANKIKAPGRRLVAVNCPRSLTLAVNLERVGEPKLYRGQNIGVLKILRDLRRKWRRSCQRKELAKDNLKMSSKMRSRRRGWCSFPE